MTEAPTTYPLPYGAQPEQGTVVGLTATAYVVLPAGVCPTCGTPGNPCRPLNHGLSDANVVYVPIVHVHPPVAATPLVSFQ